MEHTVVRCAEGHVFSTASFPMQQAERLGPGRLIRCPRCQRLRNAVPVGSADTGGHVPGAGSVRAQTGVEGSGRIVGLPEV
jgi:formate-dependent nitrite reductase complex subunit NrfF